MAITINGNGSLTGITDYPNSSVGQILNVAETQITTVTTFSSSSHARFAAMDASYTTQASNSKILVFFNFMLSTTLSNGDANPKLFRKIGSGTASEIYANPSPSGSSTTGWIGVFRGESAGTGALRPSFSIFDNPGHTAGDVLTYEHHWLTEGSTAIRLNVGAQTADSRHASTISTVLFLAVAT